MAKNFFLLEIDCNNEIKVLTTLIDLYVTAVSLRRGTSKLRKKNMQLLAYYMKYGYSKESKLIAMAGLKVNEGNLNVMNGELDSLGYLVKKEKNYHDKSLNSELIALRDFINNEDSNEHLIMFKVNNTC